LSGSVMLGTPHPQELIHLPAFVVEQPETGDSAARASSGLAGTIARPQQNLSR
jgi:hypothetical protein